MNINEAITFVQGKLVSREHIVNVVVDTVIEDINALAQFIFDSCCATSKMTPTTGDYLWYNMTGIDYNGYYDKDSLQANIKFSFNYYSTAEEEDQATTAMNNLISQLNLDTLASPQRCKRLYEYLCNQCVYDLSLKTITWYNIDGSTSTKEIVRSSLYDVLVANKAVCQGFSNAMYRLLNQLGTPTRMVQGHEWYKNGLFVHCWNIIELSGRWYNTDITAGVHYVHDGGVGSGLNDWLLKNDADFAKNPVKYVRLMNFEKSSFVDTHPMSDTSYIFA